MSKQGNAAHTITLQASIDIVKHRFITIAGAYPAAGAKGIGVTRTDIKTGGHVAVDVLGSAAVEAGAAITKGAELELDALGRVIPKAAGARVGYALDGAAAAGGFVEVFIAPA